jgi:hypothetical protein
MRKSTPAAGQHRQKIDGQRLTIGDQWKIMSLCPQRCPKSDMKIGVDFCTHPHYLRLQDEGGEHCQLLYSAIPAQFIRA